MLTRKHFGKEKQKQLLCNFVRKFLVAYDSLKKRQKEGKQQQMM